MGGENVFKYPILLRFKYFKGIFPLKINILPLFTHIVPNPYACIFPWSRVLFLAAAVVIIIILLLFILLFIIIYTPQDKVHQFCSKTCCDDYKKLHCIVTFCEYCQEEKTLHETVKFSGVKRPFCSEGHYSVYSRILGRV